MMSARKPSLICSKSSGFSLIEVLVAVLVLAIGLLGMAGLQATSLRFNNDALVRSQATLLAYDMADRMRANREASMNGNYDMGFASPTPACDEDFVADSGNVVQDDQNEWLNLLACYLPQGNGSIQRNGDILTITVRWDELRNNEEDDLRTFQFRTRL